MSAQFTPPSVSLGPEWVRLPSATGACLWNHPSGVGLRFESSADAAALEAVIRATRLDMEAAEAAKAVA